MNNTNVVKLMIIRKMILMVCNNIEMFQWK